MADETPAPVVDESSIAPVPERRNSLEKHLAQRPDRAELVDSEHATCLYELMDKLTPIIGNILPASNAAPGLQAQQKEVRPLQTAHSNN